MTTEKSTKKPSAKKTASKKAASKKKPAAKKAATKKTASKKAPGRSKPRTEAAARARAREKSQDYAASTLAAQLTESLINEIRGLDKPWHKTPEAEQKVAIARLSDAVYNHSKRAVQVLSAHGHKAVICNLFSVTFKDGVRAVITVPPGSDMRHEMADHATKDVVLVLADPAQFMKGLGDLKPDLDQPKLI